MGDTAAAPSIGERVKSFFGMGTLTRQSSPTPGAAGMGAPDTNGRPGNDGAPEQLNGSTWNTEWEHLEQLEWEHLEQLEWEHLEQLEWEHLEQLEWEHLEQLEWEHLEQLQREILLVHLLQMVRFHLIASSFLDVLTDTSNICTLLIKLGGTIKKVC